MGYVKNLDLLKSSLPIVASTMGRRTGVKVVFADGVSTAETEGSTIVLPKLADDDEDAFHLVRGYIDHESAHIRHTDFTQARPDVPLLDCLANVLEDIRIEAQLFREYPGAHDNAVQLAETLMKRGQCFELKPDAEDAAVVAGSVFTALRANHLGSERMAERAEAYQQEMERRMPGLLPRIMATAFEVADANDTEDSIGIATAIGAVLQQYEEEQRQNEQQRDSGGGDQGGGQEQDQGSAGGSGPPDPGAAAQAVARAMAAGQGQMPECDVGKMASEAIGDCHDEAVSQGRAGCGASDEVPNPAPSSTPHASAASVMRHGAFLRARMQAVIQAESYTRSRVTRQGIRIDDRLIHRVRIGDGRVFRSREVKRLVNTAVFALGDGSGSIGGAVQLVMEALMVLGLGLEGIQGSAYAAGIFPAGNSRNVSMLTRFGESVRATEKRYLLHSDGGTPMAEAMWFQAQQLYARSEPRKIAVVTTDGISNNPGKTADIIRRMHSAGIETIGIGVGTDSVKVLFQHSAVITDVAELPATVVKLMSQHYLKAA